MNHYRIEMIENTHICALPAFRQRRTHRRARINRKWRKRYGIVAIPCRGKGYQIDGRLVACPHLFKKLSDHWKAKP